MWLPAGLDSPGQKTRPADYGNLRSPLGQIEVVEPALAEKLDGARFLGFEIQIWTLPTKRFFNVLWKLQSHRHRKQYSTHRNPIQVSQKP